MPKLGASSHAVAFFLIDLFILSAYLIGEFILLFVNFLGLAWWAKLETDNPNDSYWFGPFIIRANLELHLKNLVRDLEVESSSTVKETIIRCRCNEPFTNI